MSDNRLEKIVVNPRSWETAKFLLNTWALSGSSYGLVVNLLANGTLCAASTFSIVYYEKDWHDFFKYLISTSVLSSAALIGFSYLAPATLASLALYVAIDCAIRGCLCQAILDAPPVSETSPAQYLLVNGIGYGILCAIISASSIMALASTHSFALPIAVASQLFKAAVEFNEARHNESYFAQLFLNCSVSSVGSLALLSGMILSNPMPTFGLAALYFLADGAIKTYCHGMAIFDKPAIPGVTPSLVRA